MHQNILLKIVPKNFHSSQSLLRDRKLAESVSSAAPFLWGKSVILYGEICLRLPTWGQGHCALGLVLEKRESKY